MSENLGGIDITIALDTAQLLDGAKDVQNALSQIDSSTKKTGQELDGLDNSTSQTGAAFTELAGYANSMDNQLRKLNTNVSGIARAMEDARSGTGGASSEFSRAESIIEALGNQLAVLDEAQENGARSAAVLAAQLRAGSKATDEEKQKIGELTGRLYDMKAGVENGAKGTGSWKTSMQQAGYQVQDFIVQVQGGQSALVAFAQQGSQLAGAFGPGGAVVGAIIALSSVLAGVLITSLNGGKNAMDALKDAAEAMDKVITISQNGVAALSDKYANLARTNAEAATILRNQAMIEYNAAIAKIPKSINDASSSIVGFTDKLRTSFVGGIASIDEFNKNLSTVGVTADTYSVAMEQARNAGAKFTVNANAIQNTVTTLADKFGVSEQRAFELSKQLSDVANNPTPEALQRLVLELQSTESSTKSGADAIRTFLGPLTELVRVAGEAQINLSGMRNEVDNLTSGQKNLIKQSERNLALSKLQGEARARLQAQYAAEDAGFAKDDPHTKQMEDDAAATYKNTQAQKTLKTEQSKGASQAERNAKVLEEYRQKANLSADSTADLSREQAILAARQKLTNPTPQQIAQVERDAAAAWDKAAALKAQNGVPTLKENANYAAQKKALESLKGQKDANGQLILSQEQYNQASEKLEQDHQVTLAKIRAQQVVSQQQSAMGEVDPVQRLANQHAQELALIQQFESQKGQLTQRGLELTNAANRKYEQERIAAQWEIFRNQNAGTEALAASIDSLAGNASNALTGIITGSMTASDAMRSLGSTVLNSLVNTFVQMGVEWVKSAIMGSAAQTSAIGTVTAVQTAATGVQTATSVAAAGTVAAAWTPAAILSSIASMGTAAAIGLGAVAGVIGANLLGKRKNGGPVSAGGMYQVGEGGMPEIYQASTGKQYMIPGDNGKVISNKDMQGGGGIIINNIVHNYTSATTDSQGTVNPDGTVTIETIVADFNNGGPISQALTSNHNVKRTPRGQS
ncbi:Uncharacterised protein [Citrobacter werkmanii]|uniref:Tail protein (Tape measure) n=1 Tax=Citrobacter werkmanii TaxID=67827 RepID=A0A9N8CQ91_9ENTR|nr:tail protein (tape measure) [Citrobacter werkmanii]CAB5555280.1 Uncharacterised protein [Citrobacter werkmanii]CAB5563487.1 Uncharacterised protein [Citrobacter werkmanii]CAB5582671.1 Uncharacterised protein [Citrobacter werkmanii]CAB5588405.1 Uncharacterised protein [Citrobacter werkmanii]CAB5608798.1 Uncharacterised protein [Citrobacter werkmanii]